MTETKEELKDLAMTVTFKVPADIQDATVERVRRGLLRYAATMMFVRDADVALAPDTSIDIYLTGDADGPDMFGVIYDDEDGVKETAEENEEHAWRVPVQPILDRAELVYTPGEDGDEESAEDDDVVDALLSQGLVEEVKNPQAYLRPTWLDGKGF